MSKKGCYTTYENRHGNLVKVRHRRGNNVLFKLFFWYVCNTPCLFPPAIQAELKTGDNKANFTHLDVDIWLDNRRLCKRGLIICFFTLSAAQIC